MDLTQLDIRCMDDFTKLPWFDKDEQGRIRFKPGTDVPPVYDDHSHFGWSYYFGHVIDHNKKYADTRYYYDFEKPAEENILDVQGHPSDAEAKMVEKDIYFILFRCPPISKGQTVPNMIEEMDLFGVRGISVLPIEIPMRSRHARQTVAACKADPRLIPFAGVHPQTPSFEKRIKDQVADGARGLKFHPEFQFCAPDHPKAMRIFEVCEQLGLPVLCHSGCTGTEPPFMQKLAAIERYRTVFETFPNLNFIMGHAGLRNTDEAIAYANEFPQVYLDLAGQTTPQIREVLKRADHDRILYGSDWAFYPMAVTLARTLVALEEFPQAREKVMYRNAERLLGLDGG